MTTAREILESPDYDSFRDRLERSGCSLCPLREGRSRIVVDRGSPMAVMMAVGEAPGAEEDRHGRAFIGRSGRLLDRLMSEAGIDTNLHLLVANVVKCRPPGNRPPRRAEADACLPFLRRQVSLVDPRYILLLGATAVRHLFRGKKNFAMRDEVGRSFLSPDYPGREFFVLYHPAYLLRNPKRQPEFVRHVETLKRRLPSPLP